uniref:RGS domain-containing protein n=1 Tax=Heligmosomoides polygyrus TaxID=6339 RepID=A0A183G3Y1_HELPZ
LKSNPGRISREAKPLSLGHTSTHTHIQAAADKVNDLFVVALLDAHNIYNKYIDADSSSSISLPKKVSLLSYRCFSKLLVSSLYLINSIFGKKYQLQVLSRRCSLGDILYVPGLLNALLEFVDDRHDQNCIQFLIACNTLEANYDSLPDEEAIEDAMSIYDKYFSMQALSPIEIGAAARQAMESEICSDGGRPARSSFCTAKQFCCLRIENRYLERFVQSPGYHTFLLELETEVRNTVAKIVRILSVLTFSEAPQSQLVWVSHILRFFITSFSSVTFSNFPRNLAEVDCMGQYHVLYDDSLAQERTTPSRIRQKLRKYLDKSTLREEEVAAEVARTIIADVHSMVEAGRR